MTNKTDAEQILKLLDDKVTPLDTLFASLGESLSGHEGFGTNTIAKGRAAFKNARVWLSKELCPKINEPEIRILVTSQQSSDMVAAVSVIAALLESSPSGFALNGTLVAVIIVRMGIRNLCPDLPP
ncbi:hypothetical protein C8R21_12850 [Nitrosospira multiformis]|uniref:Uncharacterized protein n=1 Tax=Nitrosospira multiformis TaxID=1231 RepID=A0A2T5I6J8_9PROT|nr:hypothetical protein [Nitrosospira multiformis]PTQ79439.1 hypothetical protein C8R21_12850 [Nitrosospira multiformis]